MTRSHIDHNIIFISSKPFFAECSEDDANSDSHPGPGDDLDVDNEEPELNSGVLAHVELARSVREFGPHW